MVMRICTGPRTAEKEGAEIKGKNGGPSSNNRELANSIASDCPNARLSALSQIANIPRALAYVAATAPYEDIRDAAMERLFKDLDALYSLLDGMTDRPPLPWERELVRMVEEKLEDAGIAKISKLKAWQLSNSSAFNSFVKCNMPDGSIVDYIDESPAQFDPAELQRILEAD